MTAGLACAATGWAQVVALPPPPAPPLALAAPQPAPPLTVADGKAIEAALRAAPEFPFPAWISGAAEALASPDPHVQAAATAALVRAAIVLAGEEHGMLPDPSAVDPNWALRGPYDATADFAAARAAGRIPQWAAALPRRNPAYLALLDAKARYQAMAANGGWPELPAGLELGPGARGLEVVRLRRRLSAEGYEGGDPQDRLFSRELGEAVADFQARHGLRPTGRLDAATVKAMNVPVAARIAAIDANLERARWIPDQLPPDRIVADIPAATVTLYENDQPALEMRSIVGKPNKPTPLFVTHVASIEFNPPWNVPRGIARAELWPKEAKSPGYFARHGFSVINGRLVQAAGPQSALGRIKFEIPNAFSVYMHDTPGKALFAVDSRGQSHGCVRLEKPNDLALALLADQGWTPEKVNEAIASAKTFWVRPKSVWAVYMLYLTAIAPDAGPVIFRPDIYGWDAKLNAALAAQGVGGPAVR